VQMEESLPSKWSDLPIEEGWLNTKVMRKQKTIPGPRKHNKERFKNNSNPKKKYWNNASSSLATNSLPFGKYTAVAAAGATNTNYQNRPPPRRKYIPPNGIQKNVGSHYGAKPRVKWSQGTRNRNIGANINRNYYRSQFKQSHAKYPNSALQRYRTPAHVFPPPEQLELDKLSLSHIQISRVPTHINALTNLISLDLSNNNITEISVNLAQLKNLKELDLHNNIITEVPPEFGLLCLEKLDISLNYIQAFPESFSSLTTLKVLHLHHNDFSVIPKIIGSLKNLTELDLSNNKLKELSDITELFNLTTLSLKGNQMALFPISVSKITSLTNLELGHNEISEIPSSIRQLTNLHHLNLLHNKLSSIPPAIGNLSQNLSRLILGHNQIQRLPEELTKLEQLHELDVSYNLLANVPCSLKNLRQIHFTDNPLKTPQTAEFCEIQSYLYASDITKV